MKPTIVVEGRQDIAILRALLPPTLAETSQFAGAEGRSTLVSLARTFLIKYHVPTALVMDTDTMDATTIAEAVRASRHLIGAVAGETPYEIVYCIPEIETIFFDNKVDLESIFPDFKNCYFRQFALTQPKQQLDLLLKDGKGPRTLSDFLSALTSSDIEKLQKTYPIQQVSAFIRSVVGRGENPA
jgi:hypothetical protein